MEYPLGCKFTLLGFETISVKKLIINRKACKFTPLGFETKV